MSQVMLSVWGLHFWWPYAEAWANQRSLANPKGRVSNAGKSWFSNPECIMLLLSDSQLQFHIQQRGCERFFPSLCSKYGVCERSWSDSPGKWALCKPSAERQKMQATGCSSHPVSMMEEEIEFIQNLAQPPETSCFVYVLSCLEELFRHFSIWLTLHLFLDLIEKSGF